MNNLDLTCITIVTIVFILGFILGYIIGFNKGACCAYKDIVKLCDDILKKRKEEKEKETK